MNRLTPTSRARCINGMNLVTRGVPSDDDDENGVKTLTEGEPPLLVRSVIENCETVLRIPMHVPRASRTYTSRVGPPAPLKNPRCVMIRNSRFILNTRNISARKFVLHLFSPKLHRLSLRPKTWFVHDQPSVFVMALGSAPLVEAWCNEDNELGKVETMRGRHFIGYKAF